MTIYHSPWHLGTTILLVALPFLFFLFFAELTRISFRELFTDFTASFARLAVAYALAVVSAWSAAVFFYRGRGAMIALPLFDVLQSFPTFAALPLATAVWGRSDFTIIFFLVITVIWPILFSIVSSLKLIKHEWEEVVAITCLSGWAYVRHFLFPASIPGLITGSIIGLGEGWEALVATELIARAPTGLGSFFSGFSHQATITIFGILGFLLVIFSINKLIWLPLLSWSHRMMEE